MGLRLRQFFLGRSSSDDHEDTRKAASQKDNGDHHFLHRHRNNHGSRPDSFLLTGQPYDSAVALEPPVRGSHPVTGNGPNALTEMQRVRAKNIARRESAASNSIRPGSSISRSQAASSSDRPKTAPQKGALPDLTENRRQVESESETARTRSGFSLKSPPFFRRDSSRSVRTTADVPPPIPKQEQSPAIQTYQPTGGHVQTYQPKRGLSSTSTSVVVSPSSTAHEFSSYEQAFVPPFAQHDRSSSRTSHASNQTYASHASRQTHVDLLEVYSNISSLRAPSQHRAKAPSVRNYGEDVADRNIADFGDKDQTKLDLNSPNFSYLKTVYAPLKKAPRDGDQNPNMLSPSSGRASANGVSSDNTRLPRTQAQGKASSIRSFTGPRPGHMFPPRKDSTFALGSAHAVRENGHKNTSIKIGSGNELHERSRQTLPPLSPTTASIPEEPPARNPRRHSVVSSHGEGAPIRGRPRGRTPPPVAGPSPRVTSPLNFDRERVTSPAHSRKSSTSARTKNSMSPSHQSATIGRPASRNRPDSYSAFPSSRSGSMLRGERNGRSKDRGFFGSGSSERSSQNGTVGLTNANAENAFEALPAVAHGQVTPTQNFSEEIGSREIHSQDGFQRVPPTRRDMSPRKHSIKSSDGQRLIEIPEDQIPGHLRKENLNGKRTVLSGMHNHQSSITQYEQDADESADAPVIGLIRTNSITRSRGNSKSSVHTNGKSNSITRSLLEPIFSPKRESVPKIEKPRTEPTRRHQPILAIANGQANSSILHPPVRRGNGPVYIGAGIGDLSGENFYPEDEDIEGAEFGAMQEKAETDLFSESGYGFRGSLPGIAQLGMRVGERKRHAATGSVGNVKVAGNRAEAATMNKELQSKALLERGSGM